MNRTHLTDEQLIAHLYEIADEASKPHLDSCEECQVRWAAIEQRRRAAILPSQAASEEIFIRQRQAVLNNSNGRTTPLRSAWLPAGAAALAFAALLYLQPTKPAHTVPPASDPAPVLEAGWFDEAYASVSVEPRAAQPLRELFESGEPER
jgi:hypothetical protein